MAMVRSVANEVDGLRVALLRIAVGYGVRRTSPRTISARSAAINNKCSLHTPKER